MVCKNCGKDCDDELCQDCRNIMKDDGLAKTTQCPICKTERIGEGKFCINCGYNFEEGDKFAKEESAYNDLVESSNSSAVLKTITKIYRFILPALLLIASVIAFWGLSQPIFKEPFDYPFPKQSYYTGYQIIREAVESAFDYYSVICLFLLALSYICAIYGLIHLAFAFKQPYATVKKLGIWVIDFIICVAFIVLGALIEKEANSSGYWEAGLGFKACIFVGVVGIVLLVVRIIYELKLFKWQDTGLDYKQIATILNRHKKSNGR